MKTKLLISFALLTGLLSFSGPTFAHHGAAAYDMTKPIEIKDAVVTKYLWANPHALIFFDAKDEKGNVTHWSSEIGSPAAVSLVGWTRNTLKPGDVITIYVFEAKNGKHVGRTNKLILPDGTLMRDSQVGGDNGQRADDGVR